MRVSIPNYYSSDYARTPTSYKLQHTRARPRSLFAPLLRGVSGVRLSFFTLAGVWFPPRYFLFAIMLLSRLPLSRGNLYQVDPRREGESMAEICEDLSYTNARAHTRLARGKQY